MAATGLAVSVSMGVMKHVLEKLAMLMGDKYKKLKGLRKEVRFLMDELSDMSTLLEKMDDAADELDPQAKKWRKDIIDMSYHIEDCIDDFMDHIGETSDTEVGILKKASHYLTTFKDRYRIANQIHEIKTRVIEASKRRDRYNLNVCTSSSTTKVDIDPRLSALYKDSTSFVGIDTQKKDLVKWAEDEDKQLKVMSIVGFGGLGKTTLANEVYLEVKGNFNRSAFVPVSQKPDVPRLLSSMRSKLGWRPKPGMPQSSDVFEVQELIDTLRDYLRDKRYFIVLDDLWEVKHWDIISCAFPPNSQQSRLIVTTRIEGVARTCRIDDHGCIHYMKPLSDVDSRKLFYRRIFGNEDTCPPQFTEISCEILKKCGGLPLAIVTMASTLVDQPIEQWEYIKRSIVTESAANSLDDMMQILDLSYKHLPRHLRACFLYLGIYPEDYEIRGDELIDLWVAERIVMSKSSGQDARDVAESYFNELVNRNMVIQQDKFCYYKVHDMMLDLILKRCREDNFVSVVHSARVVLERQDRVHRLSVNFSGAADDDTILQVATSCCRSQVRSLFLFGASNSSFEVLEGEPPTFGASRMPPLSKLRSLRVLYLKEFPEHLMRMDFTGVGQLSQLRYFRIEPLYVYADRKCSIVLPSEIWRLRHLERLEIPSITIRNSPTDIIEMPCLSHLILAFDTSLPVGIGKMKSLRTLSLTKNSPENIKGLDELNKLQEICFNCGRNDSNERQPRRTDGDMATTILMDALVSSLEKLSNLKHLVLRSPDRAIGADALSLLSPPFHNLEELHLLALTFSRVPRWIGDLPKLRQLSLGVKQMPQEDIGVIGTLPSLLVLWLWIPGVPTHKVVIGGSMGFRALEVFRFNCDMASYLIFENGAMPNLRTLQLSLDAHEWDKATPLGLQYLSSLKEIIVGKVDNNHNYHTSDNSELELVSRVFQEAADAHPNHPAFVFDKEFWHLRPREEAQD